MGCGGGSDDGGAAAPASPERETETEGRDGQDGEPGQGEDGEDGAGQDGEDGEAGSSQSNSITQSSDGGSVSSSSSSSNVNGRGIKTFSGTGSTELTFNVEQPSRLVWTNSERRRFSASGEGISIDSRAGGGEVALQAGRYEDVRVSGANWTVVVRPR